MSKTNFAPSGQAEIIRASQKDEYITNSLQEQLSEVLFRTVGNRAWLRMRGGLTSVTKLLYHCITTLGNFQTIGEEYTGIVQVDKSHRVLPTKSARLLAILLDSFGENLLVYLLQAIEKDLKHPRLTKDVRPEAREQLLKTVKILRQLIPFIQRLHKATFFLKGGHYHIGKRIAGVHYILARFWLANRRSDSGFRLLGIVSLGYLLIAASHSSLVWLRSSAPQAPNSTSVSSVSASNSCSLCMEVVTNVSVTPCGHLFCWDCIITWLSTNQKCPMCREPVKPSRVVPLQNYGSGS